MIPTLPRKDRRELATEPVTVKLIPYGAAKVRMTVLPKVEGSDT